MFAKMDANANEGKDKGNSNMNTLDAVVVGGVVGLIYVFIFFFTHLPWRKL